MENKEPKEDYKNSETPETEKLAKDLMVAVWKLSNDGNPDYLRAFIEKNGKQENKIDLSHFADYKHLGFIVDSSLDRIERNLSYDLAIERFRLLKEAGVIDREDLQNLIQKSIDNMSLSKEDRERIEKNTGVKKPEYTPEFLREFVSDLTERIEEVLDWGIDIRIKEF